MRSDVLMPADNGSVTRWLKKEGDRVKLGDVIAEIEIDKATVEIEATEAGTLGPILIAEGASSVAANTPIATILGDGFSDAPPASPAREDEGSDEDWYQVKLEALRLLQAGLETPEAHLSYIRGRIKQVFDHAVGS
jgi:pyruvate/2-oxoglutarate dehydrogenase complex dihydrolipoamide acyltransferase (E2) component